MSTVHFPSDNLGRKDRENLSGGIITYNLKAPVDLQTIKTWPTDIQLEYCNGLIEKYGAATAAFAEMFNVLPYRAREYLDSIGVKKLKGLKMTPEQKAEWQKFLGDFLVKEEVKEPEPTVEPVSETSIDEPPMPTVIHGKDYEECAACIHDGEPGICISCMYADKFDDGRQCGNCKHRSEPLDSIACQGCFGGNWEPIPAKDEPKHEPDSTDAKPETAAIENIEEISTESAVIPFWNLKTKPVPTDFKLTFSSENSSIDINMVARTLRMMLGNDPDGTLKIKWYKRRYL